MQKEKKRILIVLGHTRKDSLCYQMAEEYAHKAWEQWAEVQKIYLCDHLHLNYHLDTSVQEEEPEWQQQREKILRAEHIVIIFPTRRYTTPACLKGRFDKVFISNFAYVYTSFMKWEKLLSWRTASLITTTWWPRYTYLLTLGHPWLRRLKRALRFVGIKTKHTKMFDKIAPGVRTSESIQKLIQKVWTYWSKWW